MYDLLAIFDAISVAIFGNGSALNGTLYQFPDLRIVTAYLGQTWASGSLLLGEEDKLKFEVKVKIRIQ